MTKNITCIRHMKKFYPRTTFTANVYRGAAMKSCVVKPDDPIRKDLENVKHDSVKWPDRLEIAKGMPVILLANIDFINTTFLLTML